MKATKISPAPENERPYSATNPAPASAIRVVHDLPIRQPSQPGDVLVRVKASTVIRDNLTWPELYADSPAHLGNDFSGIVVAAHGAEYQPWNEVYGIVDAHRGGAWAEYVLATTEEVYPKPANLSWGEAASLPLSAMTADQALFEQAGLRYKTGATESKQRVLITGASGAVGTLLVQFALGAEHEVVAATSSNSRNAKYLHSLGAQNAVEYAEAFTLDPFDAVIDTVGGEVLKQSWAGVRRGGSLVTIDSSNWDFVRQHREEGIARDDVEAKFFTVKPSRTSLRRVSEAVESGKTQPMIARIFDMAKAREA